MPKRKKPQKEPGDEASEDRREEAVKDEPPNLPASADETEESENITHFKIAFNDKSIICERHGGQGTPSLIFTHGAGGGIAAPAVRSFATGFAAVSPVVCFQGSMNLTNRIKYFHATVEYEDGEPSTALGGRSMGARAAVLTALEMEKKPGALVLVSYPLMAGTKGDKREPERREKILTDLPSDVDVLFVIGSKDAQCDLHQLNVLREEMHARTWLLEVKDADHGMNIKAKDGVEAIRHQTGEMSAAWLQQRDAEKTYRPLEWNPEESAAIPNSWVAEQPSSPDTPDAKRRRTK